MPFRPRGIPLAKGLHQEISPVNMSQPDMLSQATNAIMVKHGALRGRPGMTLLANTVPDGPYAGAEAFQGRLVNLAQGGLMESLPSGATRKVGRFWSVQKMAAPTAGYRTVQLGSPGPVTGVNITLAPNAPAGKYFVATPVTRNGATGFPLLGAHAGDGYTGVTSTALTNFDSSAQLNAVMASNAKDALYYAKDDGSTWLYVVDSAGTSGEFSIKGVGVAAIKGHSAFLTNTQSVWICAGAATNEFFLVETGATAGQILVSRVLDNGTTTATLNITGLGSVAAGVSMSHNGLATGSGGALCIGYLDNTATRYTTIIVNCTNTTTLTNAALTVQHQTTPNPASGLLFTHVVGRTSVSSTMFPVVSYTNNVFDLTVEARAYTNAVTATVVYTFFHQNAQITWQPWFAPLNLAWTDGTNSAPSQVVMGVYRMHGGGVPALSQAITVALSSGRPAQVLTATPVDAVWASNPQNALVMAGGIGTWQSRQTLWEGQFFNAANTKAFSCVPADYYSVPSRGVPVGKTMVFSGETPWCWDGADPCPLGFVERYPDWLTGTQFSGAGGSFTAGASYSFQAIWEVTNGAGQVVRSGQSSIFTPPAPAAGNSFTAVLSVPQLTGRYLGTNQTIRVKVYQTIATPPAGAPLYLAGGGTVAASGGLPNAGSITITLTAQTDTTQEQLYTGTQVFDDLPPAGGGRGVAYAMDRVWVADAKNVYASKLLRSDYQVAFNESGGLRVQAPPALGEIMGVASLGDRLLVIGQRAVGFVYGPGVDDLGNGPGWTLETTGQSVGMSRASGSSPRCTVSLPNGRAAFIGADYGVWLVDHNGQATSMTRPVQDNVIANPPLEIAYLDAGGGNTLPEYSEALVVSTALADQVFQAESGQWVSWLLSVGQPHGFCSVQGVITLVASTTGASYQLTDWSTCTDLGVTAVTMTIQTGETSITGDDDGPTPGLAWGRLRSVNPVYRAFTGAPTLTCQVVADDGRTILSKAQTPAAGSGPWPGPINSTEFRTTEQRCSTFQILLQFQPATVELSALDIWYWTSDDRAPARNRA